MRVRRAAIAHMHQFPDEFRAFLGSDFNAYLTSMDKSGIWGDELTLVSWQGAMDWSGGRQSDQGVECPGCRHFRGMAGAQVCDGALTKRIPSRARSCLSIVVVNGDRCTCAGTTQRASALLPEGHQ